MTISNTLYLTNVGDVATNINYSYNSINTISGQIYTINNAVNLINQDVYYNNIDSAVPTLTSLISPQLSTTVNISSETETVKNGFYVASSSACFNPILYSALNLFNGSGFFNSADTYDYNSGLYFGSVSTYVNNFGNIYGEWAQIQLPYKLLLTQYSILPRFTDIYNNAYYNCCSDA